MIGRKELRANNAALVKRLTRRDVTLIPGTVTSVDGATAVVEVDGSGTVYCVVAAKTPVEGERVMVEFRNRQAFIVGIVGGYA